MHAETMFGHLAIVVQRLTAITVIIMVPTMVASIYGMNFDNLYLAHDAPYGFYIILGVIRVMTTWGFIHSRILGWL